MNSRMTVTAVRRFALLGAIGAVSLTVLGTSGDARAQIAGTTNQPLPNVLLLVDSSGSMERMSDNSLPSANPANKCSPGVASVPNRWGMLLQALTGNLQPYFSCDEIQRTTSSFKNEFRIGNTAAPGANNQAYDADYFLPYHRPLTGDTALDACALAPYTLPGASNGQGVGSSGLGTVTAPYADASSFPPDALKAFREAYLRAQYGSGALGSPLSPISANTCSFDQANDGQLDAARDYIRFGLMMFDNDPSAGTGVIGNVQPLGGAADTANPFAGQWSYVKSSSNPLALGIGRPASCATTSPFDVGARHWAAPPWEGRMVKFPTPDATLYDLADTNEQIQKVLLGTRPYGATPIDGMMEDARDYLWYNDYGPLGSKAGYADPYVNATCRDQYIILLTDGAPNLDLRPACTDAGSPAGLCPYPNKAAQVADQLATAASANQRVKTFVIGFSVNGAGSTTFANDGFPAPAFSYPNNNCKAWFNSVTSSGANLGNMHSICSTPATAPPEGSTADACCKLSEIAWFGSAPSHDTPPFFAETQADLVLSFGRVLGGISKSATTRTLPGYSPAVSVAGAGLTGDFIASFIPNAQKVWSGEIDRTRSICVGATPTPQAQSIAAGDSFAANTAAQAAAGKRLFVSVKGLSSSAVAPFSGVAVDSARSIRPWTNAADGIVAADAVGTQVVGLDTAIAASIGDWAAALSIDDKTCKRSRDISGNTIPSLTATECRDVIWGFTTATKAPITEQGYTKFNVRCGGGASSASGFCSFSSSIGCSVGGPSCQSLGGQAGEVCVPECSALGAIYRSSPTLVGPPNDLLRDDAYRAFSEQRKSRRPAMFVATTDGVLHAFKSLATSNPAFDNIPTEHELWAFIPPAVLPRLASNYPTGQQILLDGTPAVKDIVWDRALGPERAFYHTTLVSGMGAGGGGYYALSVTDSDCQGSSSNTISNAVNGCLPSGSISTSTSLTNLASAGTKGPQFLWQLTDVQAAAGGETAKPLRKSRDGKDYVALFGKESGNAAVATLLMNPNDGNGARQIGVAILPGGIDGPPVKGQYCDRAIFGGSSGSFGAAYDVSDSVLPKAPRHQVRQWAGAVPADCKTAPVPGRNVTIVRADTGEILRVFGRPNSDIPKRISDANKVTDAPFDSPVIGTPAVYPNGVGVVTQKIFVGDADGTLWRIDVSSPDPTKWSVALFQDLIPAAAGGAASQPIQGQPVITQDPFGGLVISASTGDQENLIASNETNYLFSIQETKAVDATTLGRAQVRWFQPFLNAERVTGPMTVFDRTLYFATFKPVVPAAGTCSNGGTALLWGMDYYNPPGAPGAGVGGLPRWCPTNSVDPISGACTAALLPFEDPSVLNATLKGAIIPGVTIRASQSCASFSSFGNDPVITGMSATTFSLFFGATTANGSSPTGSPVAARPMSPLVRPLPRTAASIDSWALVVD